MDDHNHCVAVCQEPPIDSSSKEGLKPENFDGTIELVNISFSYPTRQDVKVRIIIL